MLDHESPFRMLAVRQFQEQYGDLLSVQAQITEFENTLLGTIFEFLWIFRPDDLRKWDRRVRSAYHFLEKAFNEKNPKGVASAFLGAVHHLPFALQKWHMAKEEEHNEPRTGPEALRKALALYKLLVEDSYRLTLAPIAYSFGKVMGSADPAFKPDTDGKIPLRSLKKIEQLSVFPQSELSVGLNTHIRNAYAHEHYRVLDDDRVELWDVDPRTGNLNWGRETWSLEAIRHQCLKLEQTVFAFMLALTTFSVNKRAMMTARGWMMSLPPQKLTSMELEPRLQYHATQLHFKFVSFKRTAGKVEIVLRLKHPGIPQEEELLVGLSKGARRYKIKVEYVDIPLIDQVLGFLQRCEDDLFGHEDISILVRDPDGTDLGVAAIAIRNISELKGPTEVPSSKARQFLNVDTVPDVEMSYEIRHQPTEY